MFLLLAIRTTNMKGFYIHIVNTHVIKDRGIHQRTNYPKSKKKTSNNYWKLCNINV